MFVPQAVGLRKVCWLAKDWSREQSAWVFCWCNWTITPVLWMSGLADAPQLTSRETQRNDLGYKPFLLRILPHLAALHCCAPHGAHAFVGTLDLSHVGLCWVTRHSFSRSWALLRKLLRWVLSEEAGALRMPAILLYFTPQCVSLPYVSEDHTGWQSSSPYPASE